MILTLTKGESQPYICTRDDAVDREASDLGAYGEDLDPSHLVLHPGVEVTPIEITGLTGYESGRVSGASILHEGGKAFYDYPASVYETLRHGLVFFDGLPGKREPIWSRESVECLPFLVAEDISSAIITLTDMSKTLKNSSSSQSTPTDGEDGASAATASDTPTSEPVSDASRTETSSTAPGTGRPGDAP